MKEIVPAAHGVRFVISSALCIVIGLALHALYTEINPTAIARWSPSEVIVLTMAMTALYRTFAK